MPIEIGIVVLLNLVILGFIGRYIYNSGKAIGYTAGVVAEEARWKQKEEWRVTKAEKHV